MQAEGKGTSNMILRFLFKQLVGGDVTCQTGKPGVGMGAVSSEVRPVKCARLVRFSRAVARWAATWQWSRRTRVQTCYKQHSTARALTCLYCIK